MVTRLHGNDISGYQADWKPSASDAFVFVKATEGRTFTNTHHDAQVARARTAGLVVGHYHWLWPDNVQTQAEHFVKQAKPQPGDLLVCDWEQAGTSNADKDAFIKAVKLLAPQCRVGLYCNTSWWLTVDKTSYHGDFLWIADYRAKAIAADGPPIKTEWTFWQYTDKPLDQNWCRFSTKAQLVEWARGLIPKPPTPPAPKPPVPPAPKPKPKPTVSPVRTLLNINCQWPGFSSTKKKALPWATRCGWLASAILRSGATIVTAQELGKKELADLLKKLPGWSGRRADGHGKGLNCVLWKNSEWKLHQVFDRNLDSFGQLQRTLLAVMLVNVKDGFHVWAGSTHLAAAASDLTASNAIKARTRQAEQVGKLIGSPTTLIGGDWNSPHPQTSATSVRGILHKAGFSFKAPLKDSKHNGIDGVGVKSKVTVLTEKVFPLAAASDHEGRLVTFTTKV